MRSDRFPPTPTRYQASPSSGAALAGSEHDAPADYKPSDEELGIGEEIEREPLPKETDPIAALLAQPQFAALIEKAVEERLESRLKDIGSVGVTAPSMPSGGIDLQALVTALVSALDRNANVNASQSPGYKKPISADEMERRASAYVEMEALCRDALEGRTERPIYLLKDHFYDNNLYKWEPGDTIYWCCAPSVDMVPKNPPAQAISASMYRWIDSAPVSGFEPEPEPDRQFAASADPRRPSPLPEPGRPIAGRGAQAVPGTQRQDVTTRRAAGTITIETPRQNLMPAA